LLVVPWVMPSPARVRPVMGCAARSGVVDLGSNSVRLVVFEGRGRVPTPIFNEKAVLRLGRGLTTTGRLNEAGVEQAVTVMRRYHAVARAMGADPLEVLATAAVRDASNGAQFVAALQARMPEVPIHILPGEEEARLSAAGLRCGIPDADGILADIGGGSVELVRLQAGQTGAVCTLPLGVIRLAERSGEDVERARAIAEADLAEVPWLAEGQGRVLYLVGGAWRALARIHIAQTGYPLNIVHHYQIGADAARDLAALIAGASRRALERMPGVPRRRIEDLSFAAVVLRRLLRSTGVRQVVFSANGLREGWFMARVPMAVRHEDPLLASCRDDARRLGRDVGLPPDLMDWTAPLFPNETPEAARLREAVCWVSDIGSHDHPEYRAVQSFLRVLHQPGVALDHQERAFLALALAVRYEADLDAPFLTPARQLLEPAPTRRAEVLGTALRLAYTLSAGTRELLASTMLRREDGELVLELAAESGVFAGETVARRLERLAHVAGLARASAVTAPEPGEKRRAG
jgi:exopolyphosphatase / guanosine-5'-triphosphate,3'-diphosphate pyrophosphatase